MKKILVLVFAIFFFSGSAFALPDSAEARKGFYDGFVIGFFDGLPDSLVANGHSRAKAYKYTAALKARVNRQQLEQQTWTCISKYSVQDIQAREMELAAKCFGPWLNNFMNKNSDLLELLK